MKETRKISVTEVRRQLRMVEFFEMSSPEDLERIVKAGKIQRLKRGRILFRTGDPADRIHLVLNGAIEIVRSTPDHPEPVPVAYISPGEIIGDMALFTGSARRSAGRVPESAVLWTLARQDFERLAETIPGYGMQLARVFATRLEGFITRIRRQARRKELAGRLEYFDLPTVVQTLVSSRQTGVLTIVDGEGETAAELLLRDGALDRARCGLLEGEEAFHEIFLRGDEGEFVFQTVTEPDPDTISTVPITLTAMNLLIESSRRVDELARIQTRLPELDRPYEAQAGELVWGDEQTATLAREILSLLETPHPLPEIAGKIRCSTLTLYQIAAELFESGRIA